jgi:hypothetical protein
MLYTAGIFLGYDRFAVAKLFSFDIALFNTLKYPLIYVSDLISIKKEMES